MDPPSPPPRFEHVPSSSHSAAQARPAQDDGAPVTALFALPRVPASQSLPPKRRYADESDGSSSSPRKRAASRSSGSFSGTAMDRIRQVYWTRAGEFAGCWFCLSRLKLEMAHVFPKRDRNFGDVQELGLVRLQHVNEFANVLHLCPNCHANFDDQYKPSLVFVPARLQYFFDVEQQWQDSFHETKKPRTAPTAGTYYDYCDRDPYDGVVEPEYQMVRDPGRGGSYNCFMDEDFMPVIGRSATAPSAYTRQWHGDPMAMVYRSIQAVQRIAWPTKLPDLVKERLLQLHALYEEGNKLQKQALAEEARISSRPNGATSPLSPSQSPFFGDTTTASDSHPAVDAQSSPPAPTHTHPPSSVNRFASGPDTRYCPLSPKSLHDQRKRKCDSTWHGTPWARHYQGGAGDGDEGARAQRPRKRLRQQLRGSDFIAWSATEPPPQDDGQPMAATWVLQRFLAQDIPSTKRSNAIDKPSHLAASPKADAPLAILQHSDDETRLDALGSIAPGFAASDTSPSAGFDDRGKSRHGFWRWGPLSNSQDAIDRWSTLYPYT